MATLATVQAAYLENADYDSPASVTKARLFRTAARQLLVLLPAKSAKGKAGSSIEFDMQALKEQLSSVEDWLARNDSDTSGVDVIYPDFSGFRHPA